MVFDARRVPIDRNGIPRRGVDPHCDPPEGGPTEGARSRRPERLVDGDEVYALATIDHGQLVGYDGSRAVETAKNGVLRVGTHSRFGFGELRVRPAGDDRVLERVESMYDGENSGVQEGEA